MRCYFVLLLCSLGTTSAALAQNEEWETQCQSGEGTSQIQLYDLALSFQPSKAIEEGDQDGTDLCEFRVFRGRTELLRGVDQGLLVWRERLDINNDGHDDLAVLGWSGGAHCCWTHWIISGRDSEPLVLRLHNEIGLRFSKSGEWIEIITWDGSFDYFDDFLFSHGDTPLPLVYLRLIGRDLFDVGASHLAEYDAEIAKNSKSLNPRKLRSLRAASSRQDLYKAKFDESAGPALNITLAYLYSGRESKAWEFLRSTWPSYDFQRIKQLIEKQRNNGVLRYVGSPAKSADDFDD